MGLFQKKEHKTWSEKEPVVVKCPNCGKEHALAVFDCKYRLDGMTALPMAEYAKCLTVCECGMLVAKVDFNPNVMQLEGYQAALRENDEIVRIFKLLYYANAQNSVCWRHIADYYHEQEMYGPEREALLQYITALKAGHCHPQETVYEGQFASLKIENHVCINAECCLIDAYRRIADWDAALKCIQRERERKYYADPSDIMRWLRKEEKLIKARDTAPQ